MKRVAVAAGSYDPITVGHVDIIMRARHLFDEIYVAMGINNQKRYRFPLETRLRMLEAAFADYNDIKTEAYEGLTVNFCARVNAKYMIRGLRTGLDLEYERGVQTMNHSMSPDIETVYIMSRPKYAVLSSSLVRELLSHGGDVSRFVPAAILPLLKSETAR